jgi:phosphatidylinositol 4-kinase type 2
MLLQVIQHRSDNNALELRDSYRGPDLNLFVRDVHDPQGRKKPISVKSWSTVKDLKDAIQQILHVPTSAQRLFFGPLMTSGGELPNYRTLHDAGIYKSGEILLLDIKRGDISGSSSNKISSLHGANDVCISSSMVDLAPKHLRHIVNQARRGFALGLKPDLVLDGSGGTYFLNDARKVKVAVFKPADEEPYAENNPRGYVPQGGSSLTLRQGINPGELCLREVAAYLLDHGGFSGVPMTTLAEARHPAFHLNGARLNVAQGGASLGCHSLGAHPPKAASDYKKVGSLQEFVRGECTMDDLSPSKISAHEVHKIAILDIRIMNADRNAANLLCRRRENNSLELVPIDHGYSLRSNADVSWMDWCWLDWPQLKEVSLVNRRDI